MLMADYLNALMIFTLRVCDVSLGTMRTILVIRGVRKVAALVGFFEVAIWVFAIVNVISHLNNLWNVFGYCSGYAVGIFIGSILEEKIGLGYVNLSIVSSGNIGHLHQAIQEAGLSVTTLQGRGLSASVNQLYITLPRKRTQEMIATINRIDPQSFITVEDLRHVIRGYH